MIQKISEVFQLSERDTNQFLSFLAQRVLLDFKNDIYQEYLKYFSTRQLQLFETFFADQRYNEPVGFDFSISLAARVITVGSSQYLVEMRQMIPHSVLRRIDFSLTIDLRNQRVTKSWNSISCHSETESSFTKVASSG